MVEPQIVWIVEYVHKHGNDLSVHRTEEGARQRAISIVQEYWDDIERFLRPDEEMPKMTDTYADVETYFSFLEENGEESLYLHDLPLED